MPERKDSVDSFDDFFGVAKSDDNHRKPPLIQGNKIESSVATLIKTQPTFNRSKTPTTPEEQIVLPVNAKPKVNLGETNGHKPVTNPLPIRPESVQSKVYESDFDDDNAYEDDESTHERKKHNSGPTIKGRVSEVRRRGSDSELKTSYVIAPRRHKSTNDNNQRRDPHLPYIRPSQTRRPVYPTHRRKESLASSSKTEAEKRTLSAKNDKLKLMESRVAELYRQLENQRIENATLRTIQRREEKAIKKYEEKEYDIHRIIRDYNHEIDHVKQTLINERETKLRLEKQVEARDEKLRDQTKRVKQYEKIVQEKNLDERYELREKLTETDKKLQEYQEKLTTQEKYIENLEKNHRHEIKQELSKQRNLKRELEQRSEKYQDLLLKFEDKARQIDTMHIYAQRGGKRSTDVPSNLSKSRSLQSLQDTSPRLREKVTDYDRKRREQHDQEKKSRVKQDHPSSLDDTSAKSDKKKVPPKKEAPTSTKPNGHVPPKGKPPVRRLSTPESIEEEKMELDDDARFGTKSKKFSTVIQRDEQYLSTAQIHKRTTATEPKYNPSGTTGASKTSGTSSIFKLTEPPSSSSVAPLTKSRPKRDLDDKWSDMFGSNKHDDSTKEDLLSKLIADEQHERRTTAAATNQRPPMTTFEPSTRTTVQPTPTVKPAADPFASLFGNSSNRPPVATRPADLDDIFSSKPSTQAKTQSRNDPFESLFGTSTNSNERQFPSQNDKLHRPKIVTNPNKSIPNRTTFDEVEDFVL